MRDRADVTTSSAPPSSAVVADRWPLLRVGLARAVTVAGLRLAGEAHDLAGGAQLARQSGAGMLVIGDTDTTTVEALARLPAEMVVVALVRQATREQLGALFAAGVSGIALRSATPEDLADLLRRVVSGERAVGSALLPVLLSSLAGSRDAEADSSEPVAAPTPGEVTLTAKEREVLAALAAGASTVQIAAQLFVTPATVKTHLAHIYAKLDVNGRHQALSRAVALGIVH